MIICVMAIRNDKERKTVERLYYDYHKMMLYIAKRILNNQAMAEDAVSRAFEKIIDKFQKFSFEDCNKTKGLIGILVRDICYDILKEASHKRNIPLDDSDVPTDSEDLPFEYIASKEGYQAILDALSEIDEKSKNVIELKYIYDYSDEEIGELLNISKGNVRVRLHRAKTALLQALKRGINDEAK